MARFGFAAIVAVLLGVGLAVWVAPTPTPSPGSPPAAPAEPEVASPQTASVTAEAPTPIALPDLEDSLAPAESEAALEAESVPEVAEQASVVGVPSLPEEQVEIAAASAFEPDPEVEDAALGAPPVESSTSPERSGDLIRRMLVLYRQMGD